MSKPELSSKTFPPILQREKTFETRYPQAIEFADTQMQVVWLHDEVKVEKDIQDIRVNMTEAERHGVITTLKLFTLYELVAGEDYWAGRFKRIYKRHEFQRMAIVFAMIEVGVHKPFYEKLNIQLNLDTDEFYNSYVEDPDLKARMDFIDGIISSKNDLLSLASFSMVEGAILYSSFAYLKHFQSQGKNKLMNVVRGINFSVRDENLHSLGGAWTFRQHKSEMNLTDEEEAVLKYQVLASAAQLAQHEFRIIEMIYEKGPIDGLLKEDMISFVKSRINECLIQLGYEGMFEVLHNPIAPWFYKGLADFSFNDTFSGVGNSYHRKWDETAFAWEDTYEEETQQETINEVE